MSAPCCTTWRGVRFALLLALGVGAILLVVTASGCGGGGDDAVSFPAFVRAQVAATPALESSDPVEINDIDFANVLLEDQNQFADLLGN